MNDIHHGEIILQLAEGTRRLLSKASQRSISSTKSTLLLRGSFHAPQRENDNQEFIVKTVGTHIALLGRKVG